MNNAERDMMFINFENASKKHKNNMRTTYEKLKAIEKKEKETNGASTADFIYGNALEEYSKYFNDKKREKEQEAEQFRKLGEYINNISLEEGDKNEEFNSHYLKEKERIANELNSVNKEIEEIDKMNESQ